MKQMTERERRAWIAAIARRLRRPALSGRRDGGSGGRSPPAPAREPPARPARRGR